MDEFFQGLKSMRKTQEEMISQANFNGGWPRVMVVGLGCVALARNQDEYGSLQRANAVGWIVSAGMAIMGLIAAAIFLTW